MLLLKPVLEVDVGKLSIVPNRVESVLEVLKIGFRFGFGVHGVTGFEVGFAFKL